MREGFDNVAGHPEATLENPYVSIIGLDDLDELPISRANWRLYEGAYIDGAVGMHNRFVGEVLYNGQLVSPTMVLGASDRVVTVSADFASATGTRPIVFLYCPVQDPQTGKTSWQVVDRKEISDITKDFVRHTVRLKATSSLCILNISLDDNNGFFFLDNLEISRFRTLTPRQSPTKTPPSVRKPQTALSATSTVSMSLRHVSFPARHGSNAMLRAKTPRHTPCLTPTSTECAA